MSNLTGPARRVALAITPVIAAIAYLVVEAAARLRLP